MTRLVACTMGVSLDGFVADAEGSIAWGAPDDEVFASAVEEVRCVGVYLLGRRLYEVMTYWEDVDPGTEPDPLRRECSALWQALPKVVFSRTLTSVRGRARLATGSVVEEVERRRAEPGKGDVAIGGPTLMAQAAAAGLVDEYRLRVHPVLLGGGLPLFPLDGRRVDLELRSSRTFASGVVFSRYREVR